MGLASQRKDVEWKAGILSGKDAPTFQGGKYIDDKGYVKILRPEHPKNIRGYIYEHRAVMEDYLGRQLEPWETVHHINEIKTDNRIENFFLCTHKEHSAVHMEGRKTTTAQKEKLRTSIKDTKPHTKKRDFSKRTIPIKKIS